MAEEDTRLTEVELAKRWDLSVRTLQNWREQGIGPAFLRLGKNTIRYRIEDVVKYENQNTQGESK